MHATPNTIARNHDPRRKAAATMNPAALREAEARPRPPSRIRANAKEANERYKEIVDRLKTTDREAHRAMTSRIESYKTISDTWRRRALAAESRLAMYDAREAAK